MGGKNAAKPLVYVAGPISGNPMGAVRNSLPAFQFVVGVGGVPFMPQWSVIAEMVQHLHYDIWMQYDFDIIRHCDALLRLPGESPGADKEVVLATKLDIPVFMFDDPATESWMSRWVVQWREKHDGATSSR